MTEILDSLALDSLEEKVYLYLLAAGQSSSAEIAKQVDSTIAQVDKCLESLLDKGLLFSNPSIVKKYAAHYPLSELAEKAEESLAKISKMGDEINTFANERFEKLDEAVTIQKDKINKITSEAKEKSRQSSEKAAVDISKEIDRLIEEIGSVLNNESTDIQNTATTLQGEITKHHQEIIEASGNKVSEGVSEVVNSLNDAQAEINKSFEENCSKATDASKTMEQSLVVSLENNYKNYSKSNNEAQAKIEKAMREYLKAANDNMAINRQSVNNNFNDIVKIVRNRLGLYDKETDQVLEERIRNITQSMNEMSLELEKSVKDKLNSIRREYTEMMEQFVREVNTKFVDATAQIESLVNAKTNMNSQKLNDLLNIMRENLDRTAKETRDEIQSKEVKIVNDLRTVEDASKRKMTEINDKLSMEITGSFNKSMSAMGSNKENMVNTVQRTRSDIDTRLHQAKDLALKSIEVNFKKQEEMFTSIGSQINEDLNKLNLSSERRSKEFIKTTQKKAQEVIGNIEMPAKTLLNKGKQVALKQVQQQAEEITRTMDHARSGIEDTLVQETGTMKEQFKGFGDRFKQTNKSIENMLHNLQLMFLELLTKVKDTPQPTLKTTTLIGRDAVVDQMNHILGRVKSTITCVYPEISDIPVQLLMKSSPRTRIIIISDFDDFKNANIIKQLMSKENIQLKSLTLGSTTQPYFAAGRDGEEGIIASIDQSGEVVGIMSSSEAFVDLISNEVINSVITAKTKRVVVPEDL